jgi:hypothetical protein
MKTNVSKIIKDTKTTVSKHSPEILTGLGIAGMAATTVLAVKATPKAILLLKEAENEKGDSLTKMEMVKVAWKPYIPAAVSGVASISCLIGASSVNARRNAALAAAYNISQTALTEYKDKVVETIGEKKERAIKDKIAKEKVEKDPVTRSEVIITEKGNTLCYDAATGRYFKSDIDKIKNAVNELNFKMLNEMYVSLNDFFDKLGLSHTELGNELGWNLDGGQVEVDFSSQIADDGTPCLVIGYTVAPRYDYSKLY